MRSRTCSPIVAGVTVDLVYELFTLALLMWAAAMRHTCICVRSGLGKGVIWDQKVKGQLWDVMGSSTITLLKSKWKQPGKVYVVTIKYILLHPCILGNRGGL